MGKEQLYYFVHEATSEVYVDIEDHDLLNVDVLGACNERTVAELKSYLTPFCWLLLKYDDKDLYSMINDGKKLPEKPVVRSVRQALAARSADKPSGMQTVTVYTDGSANGKTGFGGIGVFMTVEKNGKTHELKISQGYSNTKIGRMELSAILAALEAIKPEKRATTIMKIFCDSMYAVNCIRLKWIWRWKLEMGGLAARINGDILQKLHDVHDTYPKGHVMVTHVKGHNGNVGNTEADRLAGMGYRSDNHIKDLP